METMNVTSATSSKAAQYNAAKDVLLGLIRANMAEPKRALIGAMVEFLLQEGVCADRSSAEILAVKLYASA